MTDARLPGRWLTDPVMDELSNQAWRAFTGSLMWSNEAGTDGRIPRRQMRLLTPTGVDSAVLGELMTAGLWVRSGDDMQIPDWSGRMGQSTADSVERRRESNRLAQQNYRAKLPKRPKVSDDVSADVSDESLGKDTTETGEEIQASDSREKVLSWPTAVPGQGRKVS